MKCKNRNGYDELLPGAVLISRWETSFTFAFTWRSCDSSMLQSTLITSAATSYLTHRAGRRRVILFRVIIIQRNDRGVKIKLFMELDGTSETTLASTVRCQVGKDFFNTAKLM